MNPVRKKFDWKSFATNTVFVVFPVFMALVSTWGTWVTAETFRTKEFKEMGGRFTAIDGKNLVLSLEKYVDQRHIEHVASLESKFSDIHNKINALPPPDWRQKILTLENNQQDIMKNQVRILTLLEEYVKKPAKPSP